MKEKIFVLVISCKKNHTLESVHQKQQKRMNARGIEKVFFTNQINPQEV